MQNCTDSANPHSEDNAHSMKDLHYFSKSVSLKAKQDLYDFFYDRKFYDDRSNQLDPSLLDDKLRCVLKEVNDRFDVEYPIRDELIINECNKVHREIKNYFSAIMIINNTLHHENRELIGKYGLVKQQCSYPKPAYIPPRPSE